ncbi:unnamed protein product [Chironomus riparius]|uniref:Uncharacterized protein n=1 Tax=Chironomus riparius TaxID=315576 RepID=A0A9N9S8Q6_9DIPT|nr:unnamed protein product [Chironomus riparius]
MFIKFVVILMIFGYISTHEIVQNPDDQPETSTKSIQEDTTIENIPDSTKNPDSIDSPESTDNPDNPVAPQNSTEAPKPKEAEIPTQIQQDDIQSDTQNDIQQSRQNLIINQISSLSEHILDLVEMYANQNTLNVKSPKNSTKRQFFLSFMTEKSNDSNLIRKMTVNNNFQATNIAPTQVYVENGTGQKQPPSPNIQMTLPGMNQQQQQIPLQNEQNYQDRNYVNEDQRRFPNSYQQPYPMQRGVTRFYNDE